MTCVRAGRVTASVDALTADPPPFLVGSRRTTNGHNETRRNYGTPHGPLATSLASWELDPKGRGLALPSRRDVHTLRKGWRLVARGLR